MNKKYVDDVDHSPWSLSLLAAYLSASLNILSTASGSSISSSNCSMLIMTGRMLL